MGFIESLVKRFWLTFPKVFEPIQNFFNGNFFFVLAKKLKKYPTNKVLDIGCGAGSFLTAFNPKQYLGIDINQALIVLAKKLYFKNKVFSFVHVDALKFIPSQHFDLVVLVSMTHHLSNQQLKKLLRHLCNNVKFKYLLIIDGKPTNNIFKPFLEILDIGAEFREVKDLIPFFKKNYSIVERGNLQANKQWYYYPFVLAKKKRRS